MANSALDINGQLNLSPISINRVNKFYTRQSNFLREVAVITSRSKMADRLYFVSFAFDMSDDYSVDNMLDLIAMCKAYPYAFIRSDALEDKDNSYMGNSIGDGYFMYAIHEYSLEANADNQGVTIVSLKIQPVNWKAVARDVAFISFESTEDGNGKLSMDVSKITVHRNPGESNVYRYMMDYHNSSKDSHKPELIINSKSKGQVLHIGAPRVAHSLEEAKSMSNLIGDPRVFRITSPIVAGSNTTGESTEKSSSQEAQDNPTTKADASEIKATDAVSSDELTRKYLVYPGASLGADLNSSIDRLQVINSNSFAQQTIADHTLSFPQYMGKLPGEIIFTQVTNSEFGNSFNMSQNVVDTMNKFLETTKTAFPFLTGADALRIKNPLINSMGIQYCIVDGTQNMQDGNSNDLAITKTVLIESDQSSLLARSKYIMVSGSENNIGNKIDTLLELIDIYKKSPKEGGVPAELAIIRANVLRINDAIDKQIANDKATIKDSQGSVVPAGSNIMGEFAQSNEFKDLKDIDRVAAALKYIKKVTEAPERYNDSEIRRMRESLSNIDSAINTAYTGAVTEAPLSKYTQEITKREIEKESKRIEQYATKMVVSGEAAPDLLIGEIFSGLKSSGDKDAWRFLSTIPFVIDTAKLDPAKIRAVWDIEKPKIDKQLENLLGYLHGPYGSEVNHPIYDGQNKGEVSVFEGTSMYGSNEAGGENTPGAMSVGSIPPPSGGAWLMWNQLVDGPGVTRTSGFGYRKPPKPGASSLHLGIDIVQRAAGGINRKPMRAMGDGVATSGRNRGHGNFITIDHGDGFVTFYAHLHSIVKTGRVRAGEVIGLVGSTGVSTGAHIHFEVRYNGTKLNPEKFVRNNPNTFYYWNGGEVRFTAKGYSPSKTNTSPGGLAAMSTKDSNSKNTPATSSTGNLSKKDSSLASIAQSISSTFTGNGSVSGLSREEMLRYFGALGARESSGNQRDINEYGFAGLYQMGTMALIEAGYMNKNGGTENSAMRNPRNWNNGYSLNEFLNSRNMQDDAVMKWTNKNIQYLNNSYKGRYNSMSTSEKMGLLAAAHNGGAGGGGKAWFGNTGKKDGNGISHKDFGNQVVQIASNASGGKISANAGQYAKDQMNELAAYKNGDNEKFKFNPVPWNEKLQGEMRVNNMGLDFAIGLEKLIPTYKVYLVYGNNDNSVQKIINLSASARYYELQSIRNIKVEMANQENPVAIAYFEILNPMSNATEPKDVMKNAMGQKVDVMSLNSDFSTIPIYDQIRLKAGNKIQIRMGYGNNPNLLDIVFNGTITETDGGEIVKVVAEGYGRELHNQLIFNENKSTILGSMLDTQYISTAVQRVLECADIEHFGMQPQWFGNDNAEANGRTDADLGGNKGTGWSINNPIWPSDNSFLGYKYKGDSATIENFYMTNLDVVDGWFSSKFASIFPFNKENFFRDFRVSNKSVWDVLVTGTKLFPSSIQLVKNLGPRCTTFVGIKEQLMVGRDVNNSLLQSAAKNALNNTTDEASDKIKEETQTNAFGKAYTRSSLFRAAVTILSPLGSSIGNTFLVNREESSKVVDETTKEVLKDQMTNNTGTTTELMNMMKDYYKLPDEAWVPATNFHMFTTSHNIISNQIRLNGSCFTGVNVEYGDDIYKFGSGELDVFKLKANGNLHPAYIKEKYHSDSTIESLGMAMKTAQGVTIEELEKMYDGAIIITGNALVAPGDYATISDSTRNMTGTIKCREVQHIFNDVDGFITIITPGMYVEPSTHFYSILYLKLSIFTAMLIETLDDIKFQTLYGSTGGHTYVTTAMSDATMNTLFGDVKVSNNAYLAAQGAVNTAVTAGTGWLGYSAGKTALSGLFSGARWASQTKLATNSVRISNAVSKIASASRIVTSVARTGMTMVSSAGAVGGGTIGAVILIIGAIVLGMAYNLIERFMAQKELQHKSVLKFPLFVSGMEWTAGLRGWNDTKGILDLEWENIKKTFDAVADISDAVEASGGGIVKTGSLLKKVMTD